MTSSHALLATPAWGVLTRPPASALQTSPCTPVWSTGCMMHRMVWSTGCLMHRMVWSTGCWMLDARCSMLRPLPSPAARPPAAMLLVPPRKIFFPDARVRLGCLRPLRRPNRRLPGSAPRPPAGRRGAGSAFIHGGQNHGHSARGGPHGAPPHGHRDGEEGPSRCLISPASWPPSWRPRWRATTDALKRKTAAALPALPAARRRRSRVAAAAGAADVTRRAGAGVWGHTWKPPAPGRSPPAPAVMSNGRGPRRRGAARSPGAL